MRSIGCENNKVSAEFQARLDRLGPEQRIRTVVLLKIGMTDGAPKRRQSRAERKAAIVAVRKFAEKALPEIDAILAQDGGMRLSKEVNALGSLSVETTPRGVAALAASEHVKAVLEDQAISSLRLSKQGLIKQA